MAIVPGQGSAYAPHRGSGAAGHVIGGAYGVPLELVPDRLAGANLVSPSMFGCIKRCIGAL